MILIKKSQTLLKQWFSIRSITQSTVKTYLVYFKQFLKFNETTLYEMFKTAQKEQLENIPIHARQISIMILNYKYHLDNSSYAQTTRRLKINIIISFCRAFEIEIPPIKQKRALCEPKNYERPNKT